MSTTDIIRATVLAGVLFLSGCSDDKDIHERPDELAKLPEGTQIAFVMRDPALLFGFAALCWALQGARLVSIKSISKSKDPTP